MLTSPVDVELHEGWGVGLQQHFFSAYWPQFVCMFFTPKMELAKRGGGQDCLLGSYWCSELELITVIAQQSMPCSKFWCLFLLCQNNADCNRSSGPGSLALAALDAKKLHRLKSNVCFGFFFWADSSQPWGIGCAHKTSNPLCLHQQPESMNSIWLWGLKQRHYCWLHFTTEKQTQPNHQIPTINEKNCRLSVSQSEMSFFWSMPQNHPLWTNPWLLY